MIYEKNGWYYMDFQIQGRRVARACRTRSKRLAAKRETQARMQLTETLARADLGLKLSEAIERAWRERWSQTKAATTVMGRLQKTLRVLGDCYLGDVDNEKYQQLADHLLAEGRARSTVNRYWSALSTLLKMAVQEWRVLDSVPYIRKYRENGGRLRVLSDDEERELLAAADSEMRDLIVLLLDTGCRLGEILSGPEVDLENNLLTIWEQKGGGRNPARSIPLTDRASRIVRRGLPTLTVSQAETRWRALRKRLGREDDSQYVMHALRHTCASRLVQRGVDLYVVKELLGHSSIQVTERYAHLNPVRLKQAISVLET